jgi:hypothetical protein
MTTAALANPESTALDDTFARELGHPPNLLAGRTLVRSRSAPSALSQTQ